MTVLYISGAEQIIAGTSEQKITGLRINEEGNDQLWELSVFIDWHLLAITFCGFVASQFLLYGHFYQMFSLVPVEEEQLLGSPRHVTKVCLGSTQMCWLSSANVGAITMYPLLLPGHQSLLLILHIKWNFTFPLDLLPPSLSVSERMASASTLGQGVWGLKNLEN